jgi:hypothetical protein
MILSAANNSLMSLDNLSISNPNKVMHRNLFDRRFVAMVWATWRKEWENHLEGEVCSSNKSALKGTRPFKGIYGARLYVYAQGCKNRIS